MATANEKAPIEKAGELYADASEQALVTHAAVKAVVKAWELARGPVRAKLWLTLQGAREGLQLAMGDEEAAFRKLRLAVGQGELFPDAPAPGRSSRKPAAKTTPAAAGH